MARVVKKRTRKRGTVQKKRLWSRLNLKGIIYTLFLLSFLIFSLAMLTYVVFFRVVVAAEIRDTGIIFEEPGNPEEIPLHDIVDAVQATMPKVAIIIDDMGYHRHAGELLINLPANLTFSFLPYAPFTKQLEEAAYKMGRTVMLHLPLEPKDAKWDPGPGALYLGDTESQRERFLQNLNLVPHATGVNNHMGSHYTESDVAMKSLLGLIAEKKLFFIDSYTTSDSRGYETARSAGVKTAKRTLFLDNIQKSTEICAQLEKLTEMAVARGQAIGIAHPYDETLFAFQSCLQLVEQKAQLVGVEELVY